MKNDMRNVALSRAEVDRLINSVVEARLFEVELRPLLLHNLPTGVVASLRQQTDALSQLRADVQTLNEHATLVGVEGRPLAIWLGNAAALARERHLPQVAVLEELLRGVGNASFSGPAQPALVLARRSMWAVLVCLVLAACLIAWALQRSEEGPPDPATQTAPPSAKPISEPFSQAPPIQGMPPSQGAALSAGQKAPAIPLAPAAISVGSDMSRIEAGDVRADGASKVKVGERPGGHLNVKTGKVKADGRSRVDVARTIVSEGGNSQDVKVGDIEAGGEAEVNIGVVK